MFQADRLPERCAGKERIVPGGIDIGMRGPEEFVDRYAVAGLADRASFTSGETPIPMTTMEDSIRFPLSVIVRNPPSRRAIAAGFSLESIRTPFPSYFRESARAR